MVTKVVTPTKQYIKFPHGIVNSAFPSGYTVPFQDAGSKGSKYTVAEKDFYKTSFRVGFRYKF